MVSRSWRFWLCLLFSVCLSVFFVGSINASADVLEDGYFLTPEQFRSIIGESFEVSYYDGSQYITTNAYYNSYRDDPNYWYAEPNYDRNLLPASIRSGKFLWYTAYCSGINGNDPSQFTIRLEPHYSIFDTEQIHTFIAVSSSGNMSASVYQSPSFRWYWDGGLVNFENSLEYNGYRMKIYDGSGRTAGYQFVSADLSSQSLTSGYPVNATFYGINKIGEVWIALGIPYISTGSSTGSGTFATGTTAAGGGGSGGTSINVNVDMTETNGLLSGIQSTLSGIVTGIKNLFIPSTESLEVFKENMQDLLSDHLGGLYEAYDILVSIWSQFQNVQSKSSISIPVCNVPLAGETLQLGGWTVPLKVDGLPAILYDSIAWIFDFLAVAAFINMCRNKLEIFLNPDSEVVQNDN